MKDLLRVTLLVLACTFASIHAYAADEEPTPATVTEAAMPAPAAADEAAPSTEAAVAPATEGENK